MGSRLDMSAILSGGDDGHTYNNQPKGNNDEGYQSKRRNVRCGGGTVIIKEQFLTHQGTGYLAGTLQYFIRLSGCSQPCPLRKVCDEPHALTGDGESIEVKDILMQVMEEMQGMSEWIHVTGGEPLEQSTEIAKLAEHPLRSGMKIHLQTSGLIDFSRPGIDFVTVSPKTTAARLSLDHGDEIVIVNDPRWITESVVRDFGKLQFRHRFLIPIEVGGTFNFSETERLARSLGWRWRIGSQSHKFWGTR